jgi:hypothetical protein
MPEARQRVPDIGRGRLYGQRVRSAERRRRHVAEPASDRASTGAGDWAIELRESSLFDMDRKYADVIQSDEFFRALERRGST